MRKRMRTQMRCTQILFRVAAVLLMAGAIAAMATISTMATTLLRMTLAQLTQTAQVIVRAQCIGGATEWRAGEIWTVTTFRAEEIWRGTIAGRNLACG